MVYENLSKVTNIKNGIEGNISVFIRERVEGKEDGAKAIAAVIYGALDRNYKGQNIHKLLSKKIADRDNDYFEDIATFSLYLFSMDYTNKVLKSMPNDDKKDILIKSISDNISRGLAALNMYIANDINSSMYKSQVEKTKKTLGISENFHKTFNDYLNFRKPEIIENLINL